MGKTTTAVNLAACLAATDKRVLLVDLDPQGNATQGVGIDKNSLEVTLYDVFTGEAEMSELIFATEVPNLDVAPTNRELVGAEVELVSIQNREQRLREHLETVKPRYDYIFIDCPPSLSLLTVNGLVAARQVVITLQCEYYALEGLTELLQTVVLVRERFNRGLSILGVLLTMYTHTNLSKQVVENVREHLGGKVFDTLIPRNIALSEAPSFGKPIIHHDLHSAGARAYEALAREVAARG